MAGQVKGPETQVKQAGGGTRPDPYFARSLGAALLFTLTLPVVILLTVTSVVTSRPGTPVSQWATVATEMGVAPDRIRFGAMIYQGTCAVCHGDDAQGVPMLGKPLRNSAFVQEHTDAEVFQVVAAGRQASDPTNTTGIPMPARAGRAMDNRDIADVVLYLRAIQEPGAPTASLEAWVAPKVDALAAAGPGHELFVSSCSACHGPQGQGMEGLGKPLAHSEFVQSVDDAELLKFIKTGRPIWDAANTTGLDMPPKGGNPALNDEQLTDIVHYMRSLAAADAGD